MADNLISQHHRLARGEDIGVESIGSPFIQVKTCDGTKKELSDAQRKAGQKFTKYQE